MIAAFLFFLWIPTARTAPHPASREDEAAVAQAIRDAKALADIDLVDAQNRIIALEQKMGRRDERGKLVLNAPPVARYFPTLKPDDLYAYGRAVEDAGRARREVAAKMKVAIDLALYAYGISDPKQPLSGRIVSGPPDQPSKPGALRSHLNKTATFDPELTFSLLDESNALGHTGHDGKVRIEWAAFDYPGMLGMTLYHESLHFKELLTPGVDILDEPRNEARQRRDEHRLWYRVFKLKYADASRRDGVHRKLVAKISEWDQMVREGFDPTTEHGYLALKGMLNTAVRPLGDRSLPPGMKPGLDDIFERAEDLAVAVEAEGRAREEQAARDAAGRRSAGASEGERVAQSYAAEFVLQDWLRRTCQGDGLRDSQSPGDIKRAYQDLWVAESPENLWDRPYYSGVPCPLLLWNLLQRERKEGRPFRDWAEWPDLARLANQRSRPAPPDSGTVEAPVPPVVEPPAGGGRGASPAPPPIPRCRYSEWCNP